MQSNPLNLLPVRTPLLAIYLLIACISPPIAQSQPSPIDPEYARAYFRDARLLSEADGGRLWGVELYGPLLFVHSASRRAVANLPDSAGHLSERDGLHTGVLPPELNPSNTALQWSGRRWTMVVWPLPSNRYARRRLLAHEMFHRVQPELDLPMASPANEHLATRDGRIWLRLEWRALAEALIQGGRERRSALIDALAFRARRHSLFPGEAAEERALELNEGLAEYTGLKLSGLPEDVLADRAAVALEERERQASLSRSFAYASGPAYGILLDAVDEDWRGDLSPTSDLAALTAVGYGITIPQGGDALDRAARYDGRRVIAQETARAERQVEELARLSAAFVDGPVLRLRPAANFRYSFDPNAAAPLPGVGTVYESARVSDVWGVLEVESGGVLLVQSAEGITEVRVPVPTDAAVPPHAGAGWRLRPAEDWAVGPGERPGDWVLTRR